jgi:hypothetical protein
VVPAGFDVRPGRLGGNGYAQGMAELRRSLIGQDYGAGEAGIVADRPRAEYTAGPCP